jgi:hypothetical protein
MPMAVTSVLRWSWLLGVALLAPAALPAGGADRRQPEVRRREAGGPLLSEADALLQGSPRGQEWIQVQVARSAAMPADAQPQRGWLHG